MIRSFKSKALDELWSTGRTTRISAKMHERILVRLVAINRAGYTGALNVSGFKFHALQGSGPTRYSIHVNGPWCLTFEFDDGHAYRVDFEQYH